MREGATSSNHGLIMGKRTSINKCHYLAQPFDVLSPVDLFNFLRDTITRDFGGRQYIKASVHEWLRFNDKVVCDYTFSISTHPGELVLKGKRHREMRLLMIIETADVKDTNKQQLIQIPQSEEERNGKKSNLVIGCWALPSLLISCARLCCTENFFPLFCLYNWVHFLLHHL